MRLHEEPDIFKDAISLTAEYLRLPETYVEKDYWVTDVSILAPVRTLYLTKGQNVGLTTRQLQARLNRNLINNEIEKPKPKEQARRRRL